MFEYLPNWYFDLVLFAALISQTVGSRVYGTANENSDYDFVIVVSCERSEICENNYVDKDGVSSLIYGLEHFKRFFISLSFFFYF